MSTFACISFKNWKLYSWDHSIILRSNLALRLCTFESFWSRLNVRIKVLEGGKWHHWNWIHFKRNRKRKAAHFDARIRVTSKEKILESSRCLGSTKNSQNKCPLLPPIPTSSTRMNRKIHGVSIEKWNLSLDLICFEIFAFEREEVYKWSGKKLHWKIWDCVSSIHDAKLFKRMTEVQFHTLYWNVPSF